MKSRSGIQAAVVVAALAFAPPMGAQYSGYTSPGSLSQLPQDRKAEVRKAADKARWRLGPFRVEPWYGLRDVAWVDDDRRDADGKPVGGDFTTTVGAGLRAYVRTGSRATWAFHFLPEYVYWNDRTEERRSLGRYGAGLFADFNRLGVEIAANRVDDEGIALAETFARLPTRNDEAQVGLELKLTGALSLYAGARESRVRSLSSDEVAVGLLSALDRDETALRGGLRFRFRSGLMVGAGYEKTESTSLDSAHDNSSSGDAIYLEANKTAGHYALEVQVARRQLEGVKGSGFVPTEDTFGRVQLQLRPEGRVSPVLYALRNLQVAVGTAAGQVVEDRFGTALFFRLGWRTGLTLFAEQGQQDYPARSPGLSDRLDDFSAYGANLSMELGRGFALTGGYSEARYDSSDPVFDRKSTVLRIGLSLGLSASGWY